MTSQGAGRREKMKGARGTMDRLINLQISGSVYQNRHRFTESGPDTELQQNWSTRFFVHVWTNFPRNLPRNPLSPLQDLAMGSYEHSPDKKEQGETDKIRREKGGSYIPERTKVATQPSAQSQTSGLRLNLSCLILFHCRILWINN